MTGVVLDARAGPFLSPGGDGFEDKSLQPLRRGVQRCGKAGRACAEYDDVIDSVLRHRGETHPGREFMFEEGGVQVGLLLPG